MNNKFLKEEIIMNTEEQRKKIILLHYLEMLELYEFELYVDTDTNEFALSDNQGADLGDIEGDRFATLLDVINRMGIYHKDYIYESFQDCVYGGEESSFWDLICIDFLESPIISEIADTITPDFFEAHKAENIENLTELVEVILNEQPERVLRDAIREKAIEKLVSFGTKGFLGLREAPSVFFNYITLDMLINDDLSLFAHNLTDLKNFNMEWFISMKEEVYKRMDNFMNYPSFFENLTKEGTFYQILQKFCNESSVYNK